MNNPMTDVEWDIYISPELDQALPQDGFDFRIFMQDQIWIDANKKVHKISEMSHGHVVNTHNMLLNSVYHKAAIIAPAVNAFWDSVDSHQTFNPELFEQMIEIEDTEWLNATPLMKALAAKIEENKLKSAENDNEDLF